MTYQDDDNEDLSALDRGDNVLEGAKNADGADADAEDGDGDEGAQPRDDKGRFAKQDDAEAGEEDGAEDETEDDEDALPNGKIRLKKALSQRDQLREEAERLRAELAEARAARSPAAKEAVDDKKPDPLAALNQELDALYEEVEEARADGDTRKAATLQREIDAKNREIMKVEAEDVVKTTTTRASEGAKFDVLLDKLEAEFAAINPDSDDFSPDAVAALEFYVEAHEKMGMKPAAALQRAAAIVLGQPKTAAKPAPAVAVKRRGDAKKAIDTQKRQPPDMAEAGTNTGDGKIKVTDKMTDAEWDALPESTRAKMRGDLI